MKPLGMSVRGLVTGLFGVLLCGFASAAPQFAWRGFMLDEARHFFGKGIRDLAAWGVAKGLWAH